MAKAISLFLLISSTTLVLGNKPNGFTMRLIHCDSPDSPFYPGNLTRAQTVDLLVRRTKARAYYGSRHHRNHHRLRRDGSGLQVPAHNMFLLDGDARTKYFCPAMHRSPDQSCLIGAFQQRNHRIIYDTTNGKLHFGTELCHISK
ncbi:hypothetical protein ACFXTH_007983 [Malus domestica]